MTQNQIVNPLASTSEWKKLVAQYKRMLKTYQPGPKWYFGVVESGVDWDGNLITMEELKRRVARVSPVGPEVPIDEIVDVTPSFDDMCKMFPDSVGYYDYDKFSEWVAAQTDVFHYGRGKENFFYWQAFSIASKLGYRKIICENYS